MALFYTDFYDPLDSTLYTFTLSDRITTKESPVYKTVNLTHQTAENRNAAKREAEVAAKGRKASINIETSTYGKEPFALFTLSNDHGQPADDFNPKYMNVRLSADDLEALQDAVYAARVEIHKHTTKLKNPSIPAW